MVNKYILSKFIISFLFSMVLLLINPNKILALPPITGTFVSPDISYKSEDEYRQFFQELKDTNINLVIFSSLDNLNKDCASNTYTESHYMSTTFAGSKQPWFPMAIRLAKELGIKMYFGVAGYNAPYQCFHYHTGIVGDETTDKGKLIAMAQRSVDSIKTTVTGLGIDWNDPIIAGFYLTPEESTQMLSILDQQWGVTYPQLNFYKDLSFALKQKEPNKNIMISPFQLEETDYSTSKQAFLNLFGYSSIDIVAPQDSLGTGVTKTFSRSADHYRALRDAVIAYPNKQGWANIENFSVDTPSEFLIPSDYTKLKQQILVAQPYVSNMITWIYQYGMLSNPLSDNVAASNIYAPEYTPANAVLRKKLRMDYSAEYGAIKYFYRTDTNKCVRTNSFYTNLAQCVQSIDFYLPGLTTHTCYNLEYECLAANSPPKVGDINSDGITNVIDIGIIIDNYDKIPIQNINADVNKDNVVNIIDVGIVIDNYSK